MNKELKDTLQMSIRISGTMLLPANRTAVTEEV